MNERDLWWKIVIVGGLVALAFASIWPLDEKLKFGIDLYGGYTLLYEIDDTGLEGRARKELSQNVMTVLKERVDPKGVFNLVWRPVGHNRLEIQMPRPSAKVREARGEYEVLQEQIRDTILGRGGILAAITKPAEARPREFARLSDKIESRSPLRLVDSPVDVHVRIPTQTTDEIQKIVDIQHVATDQTIPVHAILRSTRTIRK